MLAKPDPKILGELALFDEAKGKSQSNFTRLVVIQREVLHEKCLAIAEKWFGFGKALPLVERFANALAWPLFRLRMRVRRQERGIDELEQEIHGLRTLPISDEAAPEQKLQEG